MGIAIACHHCTEYAIGDGDLNKVIDYDGQRWHVGCLIAYNKDRLIELLFQAIDINRQIEMLEMKIKELEDK